jgi:hypothetical protein
MVDGPSVDKTIEIDANKKKQYSIGRKNTCDISFTED